MKFGRATILVIPVVLAVGGTSAAGQTRVLTATRDLHVDAATANLTRVDKMLVARNGDIILQQFDDRHIRYFDSRGTAVLTFGRAGGGPNEFGNLRNLGFIGDTVWIADIARTRLTFVSPARAPLRSTDYSRTITTPGTAVPGGAAYPEAVFADGSILITASPPGRGTTQPSWAPVDTLNTRLLIRATINGQFKNLVARRPKIPDFGVTFPTPTGGGNALVPFCAGILESVAADGDRFAFITGTTATATAGSYRVLVMSPNGDTVFARTYSYRPVAIPKEKNDSAVNERIAMLGSRPGFTEACRALPLLIHYPPVRSIVVGRDKTIWLEMWSAAAERSWQVLDQRGNPIATLSVPGNVTLKVTELSAAWGLETNADGLPGVVRYKIGGQQ